MIAYGRWGGLVDTTPVREHLTALRKSGYTLRELSALTGIAYNHLGLLAGRGGPKRCKSENADAILAVTPRALP
jgi:lambda repressor-like predicted transcriptional regulator